MDEATQPHAENIATFHRDQPQDWRVSSKVNSTVAFRSNGVLDRADNPWGYPSTLPDGGEVLISFETTKFEKICTDMSVAESKLGADCAGRLYLRLQQLQAAPTLGHIRNAPGRCHELTGKLKGYLALDLKHPLRLLVRPAEPIPIKPDGGLDWDKVEALVICRTEDYHGK